MLLPDGLDEATAKKLSREEVETALRAIYDADAARFVADILLGVPELGAPVN